MGLRAFTAVGAIFDELLRVVPRAAAGRHRDGHEQPDHNHPDEQPTERLNADETDDGLTGKEGTFAICTFWLVAALSEIGEKSRARGLCERMLALASPLGLYGEEIEADTGRHLGNFPQAFTHLALINAVQHVIADELG